MTADTPYNQDTDAPTDTGGVLGRVVREPLNEIEVLEVIAAPDHVRAICAEVDGLCPVTSQPDHYVVTIDYDVVGKHVIESKALKLYLLRFRNVGISCEALSATIAHQLHEQYTRITGADTPFTVHVAQQSRGGIVLEATTRRGSKQLHVGVYN